MLTFDQLHEIRIGLQQDYYKLNRDFLSGTAEFEKLHVEMRRVALEKYDLAPGTVIQLNLANIKEIQRILDMMYAWNDKGREGKIKEPVERLNRGLDNGRTWFHWNEAMVRRSGMADVGKNTEMKTGAGNWLYSHRHFTYEDIIKEYSKKRTNILWETKYFRIECRWCDLFKYLAAYNETGIDTWFKHKVFYNPTRKQTVVDLQNWTSKVKIRYLMACPYNSMEPVDLDEE